MRRGWLVLFTTLLASRAGAFEIDALMRSLATRGDATATFVEEQHLKVLDAPLRASGELIYRAPGRLEKRTLSPRVETLIYENGVAQVQRGKRRMTLDLQRIPQVLALVESVRATLAGDRAALERSFTLVLEGDQRRWALRLTPIDSRVGQLIDGIELRGEDGSVHEVEVRQHDGQWSITTITPGP